MAHRIILFASIGILFVHSSEETAPGIEQNKYETVPTTNINSNNAIVLEKESCVREGYHPAENLNECSEEEEEERRRQGGVGEILILE